jgi:Nucleotidyl transferase AbiEii toxin, Type IV TA system
MALLTLAGAWLSRLAASPHAGRFVARGSLVTQHFFPARVAADVDHLVTGPVSGVPELDAWASEIAGDECVIASRETIWAETERPGLRLFLEGNSERLQVDIGFGDPLAVPPRQLPLCGVETYAVRPESMAAWKIHGLVEFGRGVWRPKDLFDASLYATLPLSEDAVVASLRLSFDSRGQTLGLADRFFEGDWGQSRGSRRRWQSWRRRGGAYGAERIPDLEEALARVRSRFGHTFRRARSADV